MRRIKLSTLVAFVLAVSSDCGAPVDCPCDTTICSCDGKPPPEITPNTTPMKSHEHVCEDGEVKLSATHELVIPCNRGCDAARGGYFCMEKCRCVDRSEWEAFGVDVPSRQKPAEPAKKTAPKKTRPVRAELEDPFEDGSDTVDNYLEGAAE
jgi:hypothetical protein